ncbi:MAG: hypothetical protein PHC46_03595 [Clostridia bacterium]|nr:hypothetical protein [Clostridia bacterium]
MSIFDFDLNSEKMVMLDSSLRRFLESTPDNAGLNIISAISSLFLNKFDVGEKERLENSLKKLLANEQREGDLKSVLKKILDIISNGKVDRTAMSEFVNILSNFYNGKEQLASIYRKTKDKGVLAKYIQISNQELININKKIYDKLTIQ